MFVVISHRVFFRCAGNVPESESPTTGSSFEKDRNLSIPPATYATSLLRHCIGETPYFLLNMCEKWRMLS
jgi:hypothetical protein